MGLAKKYVFAEEPLPAEADRCGKQWDSPSKEGGPVEKQTCLRAKGHREGCSSMRNGDVVGYMSRKIVLAASEIAAEDDKERVH